MDKLGEKIKKKRKHLGWSLDELARKSNISKAYLSQLETGESDRPSAKILYNIAMALGLSIAELLGKKMILEERDERVPKSLERAAIEYGWSQEDIKRLLGATFRAKKNRKELSKGDWFYLYETIKRITKR